MNAFAARCSTAVLWLLPAQMIKSIADCGANVIITSSKFSEMAAHYCERYHIMMLKASARLLFELF